MAEENKVAQPKAKETKQTKKVPARIENALKNANKVSSEVNDKIKSLRLSDFNDVVALENIVRILDANDNIKAERNLKRRTAKNGSVKVNNSYSVIVSSDPLSKDLISLTRRVIALSSRELASIQERFLSNNIDDIVSSLDSNKNLIEDTKEIVAILMKNFTSKNGDAQYTKGALMEEIAALLEKKVA